ncbi:hypothetical protein J5X84_39140 [Streptosporangiaceae bacterium NEAU-GS5]|nr:hypothetical protein [Streptosporangiaceae bacterium NEAU-GS5]
MHWLGEEWHAFADALLHPVDQKDSRLAGADGLPREVDVQGGRLAESERFVTVGVSGALTTSRNVMHPIWAGGGPGALVVVAS